MAPERHAEHPVRKRWDRRGRDRGAGQDQRHRQCLDDVPAAATVAVAPAVECPHVRLQQSCAGLARRTGGLRRRDPGAARRARSVRGAPRRRRPGSPRPSPTCRQRKVRTPESTGKWSIGAGAAAPRRTPILVWGWRLRLILSHDRPQITGYDQDLWAERLHYADADPGQALELFGVLRAANLRLLERATPQDMARVGVHSRAGRGEHRLPVPALRRPRPAAPEPDRQDQSLAGLRPPSPRRAGRMISSSLRCHGSPRGGHYCGSAHAVSVVPPGRARAVGRPACR